MRVSGPQLVLAVVGVLVVGGLVAGAGFSWTPFALFNPDWEGTSELRTTVDESESELHIVQNTTQYESLDNDSVAFVIAPDEEYRESDIEAVQSFLNRGGTLVVADHRGPGSNQSVDHDQPGNALLAELGATARVNGTLLRDERHHYEDPRLPVATKVTDHQFTRNVTNVTLNRGTAVEPGNATVLVATSEHAYLNENGTSFPEFQEPVGSHPVVTVERIGAGRVVVVSDPSVFINAMQEREGNAALTRALIGEMNHAAVDVSHTEGVPPLVNAWLTVQDSTALQVLLALGSVSLVVGGRYYVDRRRRKESPAQGGSRDSIVAGVRERYPDWKEPRVRRLIQGVLRTRSEGDDDD